MMNVNTAKTMASSISENPSSWARLDSDSPSMAVSSLGSACFDKNQLDRRKPQVVGLAPCSNRNSHQGASRICPGDVPTHLIVGCLAEFIRVGERNVLKVAVDRRVR